MLYRWIVKRAVKNHADDVASVRRAYGKASGIVGIICNCLLAAAKITVGALAGAISVMADGVNNLTDAASSVVSLVAFHLSGKPADKEHPYGHGRYEYLAGLIVSMIVVFLGVEFFKSSISKIINPIQMTVHPAFVGVLIASVVIKLWLFWLNTRMAKAISSETLRATATDSRNDALITVVLLASMLVYSFYPVAIDGYLGAAVSLFIFASGLHLAKDTVDPLLGRAPDENLTERIRAYILTVPNVLGAHDFLLHDYGVGKRFASVHIEVDSSLDFIQSHKIADAIEQYILRAEDVHLIVHVDPLQDGDLLHKVQKCARRLHSDATVHDLTVKSGDVPSLSFDCCVPESLPMSDAEVIAWLNGALQSEFFDYEIKVTVDRSFAPIV